MKADFIRAALKSHFSAPECSIVYEVANATGFDARRRIDAVAMDLWPSRGLALHAIEIKVARSDWRREKATPEKAEELAQFCDKFWIAAPEGLIPAEEIPEAWGLLSVTEDCHAVVRKPAIQTPAQPIGRPFVAALLRAATRPIDDSTLDAMLAKHKAAMAKTFEERVQARAEMIATKGNADAANWRNLIEAIGEDPSGFFNDRDFVQAVRCVWKSGATNTWSGLRSIQESLAHAAETVKTALAEIGVEEPKKPARKKRGRAL